MYLSTRCQTCYEVRTAGNVEIGRIVSDSMYNSQFVFIQFLVKIRQFPQN